MNTYELHAKVQVRIDITIQANSLPEAISQACGHLFFPPESNSVSETSPDPHWISRGHIESDCLVFPEYIIGVRCNGARVGKDELDLAKSIT